MRTPSRSICRRLAADTTATNQSLHIVVLFVLHSVLFLSLLKSSAIHPCSLSLSAFLVEALISYASNLITTSNCLHPRCSILPRASRLVSDVHRSRTSRRESSACETLADNNQSIID